MVSLLSQSDSGIALHISIAIVLVFLADITTKRVRKATFGYQVLLMMSTLPWLQHYQWMVQTRGGWGLSEGQSVDSGLRFFMWASPLAVYLMLAIALRLVTGSTRGVYLAAGLPAMIFLVTWFVVLPMLAQGASGQPYVADNMPQIWLFFESAVATVVLFACATGMKVYHRTED